MCFVYAIFSYPGRGGGAEFTEIPHPRINVSKMTGKPGDGGIWPGDRYTDRYAGISYISRYDMVMVLCIY
jgi:hypothetical protein